MLTKGSDHQRQLAVKKDRLYKSIKAVHGESNDELYALAGVRLEDFEAFEQFVLGILQVYDQTVSQEPFKTAYDFRSPALKLTFDFQRAVRISHQRLKSVAGTYSDHIHNGNNSPGNSIMHDDDNMKEVLNGMLKEVSENADQLEQEMKQNMILFSAEDGRVETVLKLGQEREENVMTLVDQDNNEYVMMRPSDATVIIEGIALNSRFYTQRLISLDLDAQLIHDFILILVTAFVLGWMFTSVGLPG
jgi:hypothetical protein